MTVFVTYRLADALPFAVQEAYREERRTTDRPYRQTPNDANIRKERARLFCDRVDRVLDGGVGSCALRQRDIAKLVWDNLLHHDSSLYTLEAAVVMPNHVHVIATLDERVCLAQVTHAWKSYTAKEAIKLGCAKPFWQDESYDHIVRNELELDAYRRYILRNPEKARLKEWPWIYDRGVGGPPASLAEDDGSTEAGVA